MTKVYVPRPGVFVEEQFTDAFLIISQYAQMVYEKAKPLATEQQHFLHGAVIASKEAGELLDVANRISFYEQPWLAMREGQTHLDTAVEELGDILFGVQLCCNTLGITLLDAMEGNLVKLQGRYKAGFSLEEAAARGDKKVAVMLDELQQQPLSSNKPTAVPIWSYAQKSQLQEVRAYVPGEDVSCLGIPSGVVPKKGDMIGRSATDQKDLWLITQEYFAHNYVEPTSGVSSQQLNQLAPTENPGLTD